MRRADFHIVLVLLIAAALRFSGLSFGQPIVDYAPANVVNDTIHDGTPLHPDEFLFIQRPLRMLLTGDFNPKFFHNPSFLINANFVVFWLTGERQQLTWAERDGVGARSEAPFRLYINGRVFSALGGVLAVAATYGAGRRLAGRDGARVAAWVVALSLPMVQHAHYATTSSLAAGFVALTVWAALASLNRSSWWLFALSAVSAGLAAGNRYNAAAVSLVVFFVGWIWLYRDHTLRNVGRVLVAWLLFPLTFLITTPYVLLDTAFFLDEFRFITNQYIGDEQNALNVSPSVGLAYEYGYLALFGLSAVGSVLAVLGVVVGLVRADKRTLTLLLMSYVLPYSYVVLRTIRPIGADQMLVPVIPVFALFAGLGFAWLAARVPSLAAFYVALLLGVSLALPTLQVVMMFNQADTRYIMQAWVFDNLPRGAHIHLDGPYNVPLDETLYMVSQSYGTGDFIPLEALYAEGVEYVIVSDAWFRHFERTPYVSPDEVERVRAYVTRYEESGEVLFSVPRPVMFGSDYPMHSASYWHHPALTLYCVTPTACAGMN